jgi:hypothetical protein
LKGNNPYGLRPLRIIPGIAVPEKNPALKLPTFNNLQMRNYVPYQ